MIRGVQLGARGGCAFVRHGAGRVIPLALPVPVYVDPDTTPIPVIVVDESGHVFFGRQAS